MIIFAWRGTDPPPDLELRGNGKISAVPAGVINATVTTTTGSSCCGGVAVSWNEEIELWVLDRRLNSGWKPMTAYTRAVLVRHMASVLGGDPADVTPAVLKGHLLDEYIWRKGAGPGTYYASLKSFWDWRAVEYGRPSPMAGIKRPPIPVTRTKVLTDEQLRALMKHTEGRGYRQLRDRLIVLMLAGTGMRRAELCGITLADLNEERTVAVVRGKTGQRAAYLGDATRLALARYLIARDARAKGTSALLVGHRGLPLTPKALSDVLYRLGERAGVAGLRAHLFRHLWAHRAQASGTMGLSDILTLGGWSSSQQLRPGSRT
jgi:integrase